MLLAKLTWHLMLRPLWLFAPLATILGGLLAKITVVLLVAWCLNWVLRKHDPARRVLLWRIVAISLLALTPLHILLPGLRLRYIAPPKRTNLVSTHSSEYTPPYQFRQRDAVYFAPYRARTTSVDVPLARPLDNAPNPEVKEVSVDVSQIRIDRFGPRIWLAVRAWSLWAVWILGVVAMMARYLVGQWRIRSLLAESRPASAWAENQALRIGMALGCSKSPKPRVLDAALCPAVVGVVRPSLVVPSHAEKRDVTAILAHELAHLRFGDTRWNALIQLTSALLWFHPLVWRMRRAHSDASERVADRVAAEHCGVEAYCKTLARFALRLHVDDWAIQMPRGAGVIARIAALQQASKPLPSERRLRRLVIAIACAGLLAGGGFHVGFPKKLPADQPLSILVQDETGPIAGALVRIWHQGQWTDHRTGRLGRCVPTIVNDPAGSDLAIQVYAPGYASFFSEGFGQHRSELTVTLQESAIIGGRVRDLALRPIVGATVWLREYAGMFDDGPSERAPVVSVMTDAQGHWTCDAFGSEWKLGRSRVVGIRLQHPNQASDIAFRKLNIKERQELLSFSLLQRMLNRDDVYVVAGRVLDPKGKPYRDAIVAVSSSVHQRRTDDEGVFRFDHESCPPGEFRLAVIAPPYAPVLRQLSMSQAGIPELEIRLEAGHRLEV
ncbi:MAG: M56 family metallopeptidase, partial [Planctomycetota bacterium]